MSAKKSIQAHPTRVRRSKTVRVPIVFFELAEPVNHSVCIAGTFNDWRPEVTPMNRMGDGWWVKELSLPPGSYEYRLTVDGEWLPDPLAEEYVQNPFGGINSVLKIPSRANENVRVQGGRKNGGE